VSVVVNSRTVSRANENGSSPTELKALRTAQAEV
jgi:hypothetical protein